LTRQPLAPLARAARRMIGGFIALTYRGPSAPLDRPKQFHSEFFWKMEILAVARSLRSRFAAGSRRWTKARRTGLA
jgi:hypothetical protein